MNTFQRLIRTGVSASDTYPERRAVILSNCMALILVGALVAINISWLIVFGTTMLLYTTIGLALFLSPIILNRFHFTNLSRLVACLAPVLFIWYVFVSRMHEMETIWPSVYSGFRIYLVAVCFVPYLLFSKEQVHLLILGSLPTFLSIVFFNTILTWVNMGPRKFGLISPDSELQPARTMIAYGIISAACYVFHFIIDHNDKRNEKLLNEIQSQNKKLMQSESSLSNLNQHLEALVEKKIENIKKQNELLLRYAHANAHYVRGPVARILGLIQLKKMDTELTYPFFFEKVEDATNQIDQELKRISTELNQAQLEYGRSE